MKKIIETIKRKWAEYLLEVIVIVGSILGAFALEEWNEQNRNKSIRKSLVISLKTELKENLELAKHGLDVNNHLLEFMGSTKSNQFTTDVTKGLGYYFVWTVSNSSYNSLKSSGQLYLISDTLLLNKIIKYYENYSPLLKASSDYQITLVNNEIKPYLLKNIPMNEDLTSKVDIYKLNLDWLLFNNLITGKIQAIKTMNERLQLCKSELSAILELLDAAIVKM